jgi:hypothetical protein
MSLKWAVAGAYMRVAISAEDGRAESMLFMHLSMHTL